MKRAWQQVSNIIWVYANGAMCNGGAPVGTSEKRDLGGSKGGIDSDGYEKENAGTVRVRQKKR